MANDPLLQIITQDFGKGVLIESSSQASPTEIWEITGSDDVCDALHLAFWNSDPSSAEVKVVINPDNPASVAAAEEITVLVPPQRWHRIFEGHRLRQNTGGSATYTVAAYATSAGDEDKVTAFAYAIRQDEPEVTP